MRRHGGFWIACVALACAPVIGRADSVWSERSACLISDNKAFRLGDVVTIAVQEDDTVTQSVANSLSKVTSTQGSIDTINVPSLVSGNVTSLLKGTLTPQVQYGSTRTLDGKGSYNLQGSMTTQITAVVMDVLPNGNLVIEGSRLKKSVDEKILSAFPASSGPRTSATPMSCSRAPWPKPRSYTSRTAPLPIPTAGAGSNGS